MFSSDQKIDVQRELGPADGGAARWLWHVAVARCKMAVMCKMAVAVARFTVMHSIRMGEIRSEPPVAWKLVARRDLCACLYSCLKF